MEKKWYKTIKPRMAQLSKSILIWCNVCKYLDTSQLSIKYQEYSLYEWMPLYNSIISKLLLLINLKQVILKFFKSNNVNYNINVIGKS